MTRIKGFYKKNGKTRPITARKPYMGTKQKGTVHLTPKSRLSSSDKKRRNSMTTASVLAIQGTRSKRALAVDRALKAKVTSQEEWVKDPSRADLKGVDYNPAGYTPHNSPTKKKPETTINTYSSSDFTVREDPDPRIAYSIESKDGQISANLFNQKGNVELRGMVGDNDTVHIAYPLANKSGAEKAPESSLIVKSLVRRLNEKNIKKQESTKAKKTEFDYDKFEEDLKKPTSQQWNEMFIEKRKNLMGMLNRNKDLADKDYSDLPDYVKKDLNDITSGKKSKEEFEKALEQQAYIMGEYSRSHTIDDWETFKKNPEAYKKKDVTSNVVVKRREMIK